MNAIDARQEQKFFVRICCVHKHILFSLLMFFISKATVAQKLVHYDLYVKDTIVNFTGKERRAIAVNGQIPMPTLVFTEGDTAEIVVHNLMSENTS
ncbi:MAG: Copper resistance protein precursor, partial [Bacteroidota bacterium]